MCGTIVRREVVGSPPGGRPYSPAIKVGNLVFLSGQVAINPDTGAEVRDSFGAEVRQVMDNVKRLVGQAGSCAQPARPRRLRDPRRERGH